MKGRHPTTQLETAVPTLDTVVVATTELVVALTRRRPQASQQPVEAVPDYPFGCFSALALGESTPEGTDTLHTE